MKIRNDPVEDCLRIIHQVDFVHRQHDMANAQQRGDIGMAAGLGQYALARIDQDDGEIGIGCAGRHVAGILFMARGVGHGAFARVGGEEGVGQLNG